MEGKNSQSMIFAFALLLNLSAVAIGAWYYWGQMSSTPAHLLIFVPDCPLYVLLALPILLKLTRSRTYSFVISSALVKYGVWTIFVILFHSKFYFAPEFMPLTLVLLLGHLGMVFEGLVLLPRGAQAMAFAASIGWLLVNDFADYYIGTVPLIPKDGLELVKAWTVFSSLAIPAMLYFFMERINNAKAIVEARKVLGF